MTFTEMLTKWQGSDADQYGQRAKAGLCCALVQNEAGKWDFCLAPATVVKQDTLLGVTTERAYCADHDA